MHGPTSGSLVQSVVSLCKKSKNVMSIYLRTFFYHMKMKWEKEPHLEKINPILPRGGGIMASPTMNPSAALAWSGLLQLPDFVPFHICQVPESQFWCLFFKKIEKN